MSNDCSQSEMMALTVPGEGHRRMQPFAGRWNAAVKFFMAPGAPPAESTGVMENEWILGGRYMEQRYKAEMFSQTFEGRGLWGHCNGTGLYDGNWVDTMGTGMMFSRGSCDASGRVFTMAGEVFSPGAGGIVPFRAVATIVDDDHNTYDMYFPGPDGAEMRIMSIAYTRAK